MTLLRMRPLVPWLLCALVATGCATTRRPPVVGPSVPPEDHVWYDQNVTSLIPEPPPAAGNLADPLTASERNAADGMTPYDATASVDDPGADAPPAPTGPDDDPTAAIFPGASVRDRTPDGDAASSGGTPAPADAVAATTSGAPGGNRVAIDTGAAPAGAKPVTGDPARIAAQSVDPVALPDGILDATGNETITLPGDALFESERATLRPDGRATLDTLADRLHGSAYRSLKVVAHADRSGAVRTNYKLSWQRARAVRNHLAARGIPRNLIEYEGMGPSQARIDPAQCRGDHRARARCLAPDRRVDVIVVRPPAS
jgi:outer membrane protein OmpA-like peptidoglycan-associated protein